MAKGNHSFTEQDIRKRFGAIVGHTVAEVDTADVLAASKASRNKGRIGAVIEQSVLGYPADSDSRPDILIDGQPWEVKATGLKEGARGGWCAKEPMSITAVAPEGIVTESFSTSAFWHKAERLLVRGTGTDANDKPVTVNGVRMYRQNVWIKGKELVGQLDAVRFL